MPTDPYAFPSPAIGQRVVSLVPSTTETLFDFGLGARLVGVTDYCIHPADALAGLPRIGGPKNPDVAAIIALQADLVIANQEENREADVLALREAGIPVWLTYPRTVRETIDMLWTIVHVARITATQGPRIAALEHTVGWQQAAASEAPPVRVFVPVWRYPRRGPTIDAWMTASGDTYVSDLLRVCGAENVFDALPDRYGRVSTAEVVAADPDLILLPSEPFEFSEAEGEILAALPDLSARIALVDGTLLTWHGTRLGLAIQQLPALIAGVQRIIPDTTR